MTNIDKTEPDSNTVSAPKLPQKKKAEKATSANMPRWLDVIVLPMFNLMVALLITGVVVALVGQNPAEVLYTLVKGAFGSTRGLSYTLYYTTTYIFTGLAVAVAFHGGLFNIGGEGQALIGGLGAGLAAILLGPLLPAWSMLPIMLLAGCLFGMAWAAIPAYLQAYRGSHIVITTIMFNFLAAALFQYLMLEWIKPSSSMAMESAPFASSAVLPKVRDMLGAVGVDWPRSPFNASFLLAMVAAFAVYGLLWHTRFGYRLRAAGASEGAARYAGLPTKKMVVMAMGISGALAGMVAMNELSGVAGRLQMDFVAGAGFTGIAVALMGRNHPFGIVLASLLFGALSQGGTEVAFVIKGFSKDMVVAMQGFIVLFSGAMAYVFAPVINKAYQKFATRLQVVMAAPMSETAAQPIVKTNDTKQGELA